MAANESVYKVKVNAFEFTIDAVTAAAADLIRLNENEYHLLQNNRSVRAKILRTDTAGKHLQVEVEGQTFDVVINDALDLKLEQMGFSTTSTKRIREIKAPMPGLVLSVAVSEGQAVKEGDRILILEAMKMENSILIHADATIKRVAVRAGQAVDKGQVLVELE